MECDRSSASSTASLSVLDGQYILHNTLGSGGFAKVKAATHCLTGEKVAIKIMDKRLLGEDLHRVKTELDALKDLQHQHICRLYQHFETTDKIFLILEYCPGGELFDYIVRKDRLSENEARRFFRQIISAIGYVHSMGYAHRDLKPENLLLSDGLQIKLIDFGLCAKPEGGMAIALETCCGSPAYAAPELIAGTGYHGNEADIWSLGVLLYALLCGFLPFDGDNLRVMYQQIQGGNYNEPAWLSSESKDLMRRMLQVNPRYRITVQQLMEHAWVRRGYTQPVKWHSVYRPDLIDEDCLALLAVHLSVSEEALRREIAAHRYDYTMASYQLLVRRKARGLPLRFRHSKSRRILSSPVQSARPPPLFPTPASGQQAGAGPEAASQGNAIDTPRGLNASLLKSPTIHLSLENKLDEVMMTGGGQGDGRNEDDDSSSSDDDEEYEMPLDALPPTMSIFQSPYIPFDNSSEDEQDLLDAAGSDPGTDYDEPVIVVPQSKKRDEAPKIAFTQNQTPALPPVRKPEQPEPPEFTPKRPPHSTLKQLTTGKENKPKPAGGPQVNDDHYNNNNSRGNPGSSHHRRVAHPTPVRRRTPPKRPIPPEADRRPVSTNESGRPVSTPSGPATAAGTAMYTPSAPLPNAPNNVYSRGNNAVTPFGKQLRLAQQEQQQQNERSGGMQRKAPEVMFKAPTPVKGRRSRSRNRTPGGSSHQQHQSIDEGRSSSGHKQRTMFTSLERGLDRMLKAMTPKKRPGQVSEPRRVKTFANISTTSTESPERVLAELLKIMKTKQDIEYKQDGWFIRGKSRDRYGREKMNFELEIVKVTQLGMIGVRRKRLAGDAFLYKRICEDILKLAEL